MRSVKPDRKSSAGRGRIERGATRGVARPAQQPFGRRKKPPGMLARAFAWVQARLTFRRPMLSLTVGLTILAVLTGLFAGGVIGRAVHRTGAAIDSTIAGAGFGISRVHLAGNVRTSTVTIMAALDLHRGQSIFGANLVAARRRLLQLPWIAEADVRRRYPDDISVRVVEKTPYARWQSPRGLFVVQRDGGSITGTATDAFARLPLLIGDGAPQAAAPFVEEVARHRAIVARVQAYQYQSDRRWNLLLDDGVVVKLPETGWRKQLDVLDHLIVDQGVLERDISEIDLRSPTHYFFVRRTSVEKEKKSESGSAI